MGRKVRFANSPFGIIRKSADNNQLKIIDQHQTCNRYKQQYGPQADHFIPALLELPDIIYQPAEFYPFDHDVIHWFGNGKVNEEMYQQGC